LAKWLILWIRARKIPNLTDDEIHDFLARGIRCNPAVLTKVKSLSDEHTKLLNLGHDWLISYLPFCLQKINRVHFGLLHPADIELLESEGVKIPTTRKLVSVPFVAKDVPSRASEFAHPDILIGLTILAYRYEGLRANDFHLVMRHLREGMEEEAGPFKSRPCCQRFEQWVLSTGRKVRGSKKKNEKRARRAVQIDLINLDDSSSNKYKKLVNSVFTDVFGEQDEEIWPLQLIDTRDGEQFKVLYPLLFKLPHSVMYYLNELIFPEALKHQGLKLSSCGQELGGEILFGRRIGFSGTPSDILPIELGSCQYERGSDGKVVHYLTSPAICSVVSIPAGWNVYSLLDHIAKAENPIYHALIDTGALITGISNKRVAEYLLRNGLSTLKGVVFLDEKDRQMVLLRKGYKVFIFGLFIYLI